jgi:hypothetical protein
VYVREREGDREGERERGRKPLGNIKAKHATLKTDKLVGSFLRSNKVSFEGITKKEKILE